MANPENCKSDRRVKLQEIALQVFIALASTTLVLQLWKTDLRIPFSYSGDTIYELALVKSIADGGWIWFIERLGAPFGLEIVAFPQNLTTSSVVMKAISTFTSEPGLILNVFWIASIAATSALSYTALRTLGTSKGTAISLSTLYALMPYALYRNVAHISLTYIFIPTIAAFAVKTLAQAGNHAKLEPASSHTEKFLLFGSCIAIGFDYVYNSFFSCFFLGVSGLLGSIISRSAIPLRKAATPLLIIIACAAINIAPTLENWSSGGGPTSMNYKNPAEAEIYGLKIRHIVSPLMGDSEGSVSFPLENENQFSTPGAIGAIGFLLAIYYGIRGRQDDKYWPAWSAGSLTIIGTLLATIGGFGAIFNLLISPDIRAYNRIIVFLAFFSFYSLSIALDSLQIRAQTSLQNTRWRAWTTPLILSMLAAILIVGLAANQKYANRMVNQYETYGEQMKDERAFVSLIEHELPTISQIYQLPETNFPLDGGRNRQSTYDHGRPYLWSHKISWSWPNFSDIQQLWAKEIGTPDSNNFIENLIISGFTGIWLDRFGYNDMDLERTEKSLEAQLGEPIVVSSSNRYALFDLRAKASSWQSGRTVQEHKAARTRLLSPIEIQFARGFFGQEIDLTGNNFRWSSKNSTAFAYNPSHENRVIELRATVRGNPGGTVSIESGTSKRTLLISPGDTPFTLKVEIEAQSKSSIVFSFNGARIEAPGDPREMYFSIVNPTLHEVN